MRAKPKVLTSIRLHADDKKFIDECIPERRQSEFIQRAVQNAIKGLNAIRAIQTTQQTRADGTVYTSRPQWAAVLDFYTDQP
jgi:hypothetical protein